MMTRLTVGQTDRPSRLGEGVFLKPPRFDYVVAHSVIEVVDVVGADEEARILAGGQSLVPLMNLRLARPTTLVDINSVDGLDAVDVTGDSIEVGALVRHGRLERLTEVPLLAEAASRIGHPQVRNRGTIGGTVAHGDPAAEISACLVALGAVVVVESRAGRREVPAREFFIGFLSTALRVDEMVVAVRIPRRSASVGTALVEEIQRHGDYAYAGVAVVIERDGVCERVGAGAISLADRTLDVSEACTSLIGESVLRSSALDDIVGRVDELIDPPHDIHADAQYRRDMARLVVADAVRSAWVSSGGEVVA
jgi:carbon-monoxide dehydrogenase medium subunit